MDVVSACSEKIEAVVERSRDPLRCLALYILFTTNSLPGAGIRESLRLSTSAENLNQYEDMRMPKMGRQHWSICFALFSLGTSWLLFAGGGSDEEKGGGVRAHEWGTFTTLHKPNGTGLAWYQRFGRGGVSDLPGFVQGNVLTKMGVAQARMETPVIYFYTDEPTTIDVAVNYQGGLVTEWYPGFGEERNRWDRLELIPPGKAGHLTAALPVDSSKPDNHYYEARAVPEAAFVRRAETPDQLEKFLFYRGAGSFFSGMKPTLGADGKLSVQHFNEDHGLKHVWVVQSSAEAIKWKKLPGFAPHDRDGDPVPEVIELNRHEARASRESSIEGLKQSMTLALTDAGLTSAEATAMIATWDEQWYEEPGQRVFSIVPQGIIDKLLPLDISPGPSELTRVFVHRAELLSPETMKNLEMAMAPGTDVKKASKVIAAERLGRFVQGAMDSVAVDVGFRTQVAYKQRGLEALNFKPEVAAR